MSATTPFLLTFLAGAGIGGLLGRWWAETRRAQRDMRRIWHTRTTYRKRRR